MMQTERDGERAGAGRIGGKKGSGKERGREKDRDGEKRERLGSKGRGIAIGSKSRRSEEMEDMDWGREM